MSTTYNIEIREFNGIDYDILYPITTITNVNGLTTSLNELSSDINSTSSRIFQNETKILSLESDVSSITSDVSSITSDVFSITTDIDSINSDILGMQGDISDLDLEKQDAADLGDLAFQDTISYTSAQLTNKPTLGGIESRPNYEISNNDLTPGTSTLAAGKIYFYVELSS